MPDIDIDNRFAYHRPTHERKQAHERVRNAARDLAQTIDALTPESREQSLAITKTEEAMFWANAAIARAPKEEPNP